MRNPRDFFKPLAIGAPDPIGEIPFRPSRMIHFLDFSNEKMVAKVPDIAPTVDILLGNLEDAVPVDRKEAARAGLVTVGREMELGETQLWTRVNSLESPWVLDDLTTLVREIGHKLDVIMVPKVEGAWDIHYVDRLLAQLEARAGPRAPDPHPRDPRDRPRRGQPRGDRHRQPAHAGHELRPGRSGRLTADEDDPCGRRAPRLSRHQRPRPRQPRGAAAHRPAGPMALLDRAHGRRLHLGGDPARSTAPSATSATRSGARPSSGPRSCSAASVRGRCIRRRSPSPRRCSAPIPRRCASPRRSSRRSPTGAVCT